MSLTFNFTAQADVRVVISGEDLKGFEVARAMVKGAASVPGFKPVEKYSPQEQYVASEMLSDKSNEEVLRTLIRLGAREHLGKSFLEFSRDNCTDSKSARVSPVQVTFREPPARTCKGCLEANCVLKERDQNVGCGDKRVAAGPEVA